MAKIPAVAVALAMLGAAPTLAADATAEILALDAARIQALLTADVETIDRITDDDYVHVESSGRVRDKAALLDGMRRGEIRFGGFTIDENRVRLFGDVAVVTGSYHNTARTPDGVSAVKYARHIRVYVRKAGAWKNVSHQATAVAP